MFQNERPATSYLSLIAAKMPRVLTDAFDFALLVLSHVSSLQVGCVALAVALRPRGSNRARLDNGGWHCQLRSSSE